MISDKKIDIIIENKLKQVLYESQESDSQKLAIKFVMDKYGWDKERANQFVRVDLRNKITAIRSKKLGKFTLGVTRMYCNNELKTPLIIRALNATIEQLENHIDEYDKNLNGLSAQELIDLFKSTRQDQLNAEKNEINGMTFGDSNYEIVKIDTFEQAQQYYKYTNPKSRWCLTYLQDMFDNYTSSGINQLYFCLKRGYKHVLPIARRNAPLDKYGLSMISIIVDGDGSLAYCTTRWNHEHGGNDRAMTPKQISETLNVNFYETFKPNEKWAKILQDKIDKLNSGVDPKKVFRYVSVFYNGIAKVAIDDKWNYIDENYNFLSTKWFDDCALFKNGLGMVRWGNTFNFMNTNGELISPQWFNGCEPFIDGYSKVTLNDRQNFMDTEGRIMSKTWFDYCHKYTNGISVVQTNGKINFLNSNFNLISKLWFDKVMMFYDGVAWVSVKNKCNVINENGELLSDEWFDHCYGFTNGFCVVRKNRKFNYLKKTGGLLSEQWFDKCFDFGLNGRGTVILNGMTGYIDDEGRLSMEESKMKNTKLCLSEKEMNYLLKEIYEQIK